MGLELGLADELFALDPVREGGAERGVDRVAEASLPLPLFSDLLVETASEPALFAANEEKWAEEVFDFKVLFLWKAGATKTDVVRNESILPRAG